MTDEFWKRKSLAEMSSEEWEALCDGCAICCLHKVEDEDTAEVFFTNLACRMLDTGTCRCGDYERRDRKVKDCLVLGPDRPELYRWLPTSCAYRRLAQGQGLPEWHPLVTGDRNSVHKAGISVRGRALSENETKEYSELWVLGGNPS